MRFKSLTWIFIPFLLAAMRAAGFAQVATTQIVDTIYHANGTVATGTALISWPAFTTCFGDQVPAGNTSAVIGTGGALDIALVPNSGAIPVGTYYTVTYHLDDNSVTRQYWVVPQSTSAVKVAAIESTVMPTSVAIQTATKSYVDTAIAAATTGHPLDSSPLVLKTGDTMTGPLVLPADPVSSLQAATKHYVDAAVDSRTANLGSLSGQTPSYVPLATSTTASATSSHFFENANTSGLLNGFLSQKTTAQCHNRGLTFTEKACDEFDYYDDGSAGVGGSTPRNLQGLDIHGQFWGPAGWYGAEGRTSTLFGGTNNGAMVHAGIKYTEEWNLNKFGIGDSKTLDLSEAFHAGVAYMSDQGSQGIYAWFGEVGHWNGIVASGGTRTSPKVSSRGGCFAQENQSCTVVPGHYLIDRSVVLASGKITGACTSSSIPFLGSCPTDQTNLPVPSAWGVSYGVHLAPAATWDAPVAQTFTIGTGGGSGSGSFAAGDHACVIGNAFSEQRIITAVSGSAGAQTITIPLSQPENDVAIFKGDCMHLVQDADDAKDITLALPSVSLDGTHVMSGFPAFSIMAPYTGLGAGAQWATYDGGANSGFHLFAGARVDRVDTTRPDWNPFADDAIVLTLEPNSAFNVGDSISAPDFGAQKVDGMELSAVQDIPSSSNAPLSGIRIHIGGHGANGGAAALRLQNDDATSDYTPWGGPLGEPTAITTDGPAVFGNVYLGNYTPLYNAFYFSNHQPGQTGYTVWSDPSWGSLNLDSTNTWKFQGSSLWTQNGLSTSGGLSVVQSATIGGNKSSFGSIDVRQSSTATNIIGRFASGYTGSPAGSLIGGTVLGIVNSGDNWEADRAYDRLRDDGTGHQGHEWGLLHNDGTAQTGMYLAPDESGNGLSIMNGHTNCSALICLGPSLGVTAAGQFDVSGSALGITNTDPGLTGLTLTNTGTNGDQWGLYSASSLNFSGGHKLGIVNATAGNWAWVLSLDSVTSGYIENPSFLVNCWSSSIDVTRHACDLGLSRESAGVLDVGNGTPSDTSGTLKAATVNAQVYKGPDTAPTGACSTTGWAFSQDGHISFCNGTTWIQKM